MPSQIIFPFFSLDERNQEQQVAIKLLLQMRRKMIAQFYMWKYLAMKLQNSTFSIE